MLGLALWTGTVVPEAVDIYRHMEEGGEAGEREGGRCGGLEANSLVVK